MSYASMYSPKIDEELIPRLYRLRKLKKMPMTRLVNGILENALSELEKEQNEKGPVCQTPRTTSARRLDDVLVYIATAKHRKKR